MCIGKQTFHTSKTNSRVQGQQESQANTMQKTGESSVHQGVKEDK